MGLQNLAGLVGQPPHKWSAKGDAAATVGTRVYYVDGRITDYEDSKPVGPAGAEVELWSSHQDWRSIIEVAIGIPDNVASSQLANAAVKIYAKTGVTRSLLKQGRVPSSFAPSGLLGGGASLLVVRASAACDEYLVTCVVENDYVPLGGVPDNGIPKFSFAMRGFESHQLRDITAQSRQIADNNVISVIPSVFYGVYGMLDPTAGATRYLWIVNSTSVPTGASLPLVPPIPVAPGNLFSLLLEDDKALVTTKGLAFGWSSDPDVYTATTDAGTINLIYT